MQISPDKTRSYPQLKSKIDKVKVYAAGATITRIADIQLDTTEVPEHFEIAGLPLALDIAAFGCGWKRMQVRRLLPQMCVLV